MRCTSSYCRCRHRRRAYCAGIQRSKILEHSWIIKAWLLLLANGDRLKPSQRGVARPVAQYRKSRSVPVNWLSFDQGHRPTKLLVSVLPIHAGLRIDSSAHVSRRVPFAADLSSSATDGCDAGACNYACWRRSARFLLGNATTSVHAR